MKVDGITLLQMIRDGKIKESTLIEVSGGVRIHYPYVKAYGNKKLFWENDDEKCGVVVSDELLEYTFEIIEEIEKPKDIQKLTICGKDIGYGVMEEWLDFPPYQNEKKICSAIEQIAINQNKIIEAVNYLLKKEDDK